MEENSYVIQIKCHNGRLIVRNNIFTETCIKMSTFGSVVVPETLSIIGQWSCV